MDTKGQFLAIFLKHEHHIFNFILMLVPNYSDAEDLLQETATTLWSKFNDFQQDTNFLAWSYQVARYKVSNYYRTKRREFRMDDSILDSLSSVAAKSGLLSEERKSALSMCIRKLPENDQNLLHMKYFRRLSIPKVSERLGESKHTLYKRISVIHHLLHACVQKTINAWGTQS